MSVIKDIDIHVYECMNVCLFVCLFVCMFVWMYVCVYEYFMIWINSSALQELEKPTNLNEYYNLVDEKIREARASGAFDNLPG